MSCPSIKSIFILLFCAVVPTQLLICQEPKGVDVTIDSPYITSGKTYGLIIGISKYESFPALQFADKDAAAFYNFLRSKAGGNIDSVDLYYKTNEAAKAGDLWRGVSWLERRADSVGENAIIYFSGHGDAANAVEAYLLAYDAPNEGDPILYNMGGTFQIYNLKVKIKQMVSKGVKVILISDACRNNDLPGREEGNKWIFQSITEEKCGEVQMISCSGNEQSLEGKKWGDGRGVFSFHLLNGLMGMADSDPVDGQVTLYELERYVKEKVRTDTRSGPNNQPRQNPVFCCSEKNDMVMSKVHRKTESNGGNAYELKKGNLFKLDPQTKNNILMSLQSDDGDVGNGYRFKKLQFYKDSTFENLYKLFSQAISKKQLIEPKGTSAADRLKQLLPLVKDPLKKEDLQDELVGALIDEAQTSITRYSRPPILDTVDALNYPLFNYGGLLLNEALKYTTKNKTLAREINARKLVLEARALVENGENTSIALSKIDSSLSLMPSSYGYHTKGLLLSELDKNDEALQYFKKAAGVQKKWAYPMVAEGDIFRSTGKYDSAIAYYKRAVNINPGNDNNVFKLGVAFQEKGQYDSSIVYLQKVLNVRNKTLGEENYNSANCLNYLAKSYDRKGDNSTAEALYKKAISICEKMPGQEHLYYANTLNNLAGLYEKMGNHAAAKPLYEHASIIKRNRPVRKVSQVQDYPAKSLVKAPAIEPDNLAELLVGVASGKNNDSDLAPYLCGNLNIMVNFNNETMTFAQMCNKLKELRKGREIKKPVVKLTKDRATNCITYMDVTNKRSLFHRLAKSAIIWELSQPGTKTDDQTRPTEEPSKKPEEPKKPEEQPKRTDKSSYLRSQKIN